MSGPLPTREASPRPACVKRLIERHPDLLVLESVQPELLESTFLGAVFSPPDDKGYSTHRYLLWRIWDPGRPLFVVLMLNPSTADHLENDPTVGRMGNRARRMGYGGVIVINLFAWRDTSPDDMKKAEHPEGEANDLAIQFAVEEGDFLLCAWGNHGTHRNRSEHVIDMLRSSGSRLHKLNITQKGQPEHPLYLSYSIEPTEWLPTEVA